VRFGAGGGEGHDRADAAGRGTGIPLRGPADAHPGGPRRTAAGIRRDGDVPPHFAGSIPHAHDDFGEAICVLSGQLLVLGEDEPQEAPPGSMFVAPRGHRDGFSNPSGEVAQVLGL
jgi:hypothetical protein